MENIRLCSHASRFQKFTVQAGHPSQVKSPNVDYFDVALWIHGEVAPTAKLLGLALPDDDYARALCGCLARIKLQTCAGSLQRAVDAKIFAEHEFRQVGALANHFLSVTTSGGRCRIDQFSHRTLLRALGLGPAVLPLLSMERELEPMANIVAGGPSIDQHIGSSLVKAGYKGLPSLNLGIFVKSTGRLSWRAAGDAVVPTMDPYKVFTQVFGASMPAAGGGTMPDPAVARKRALKKSVLDHVITDLTRFSSRVGTEDKVAIQAHLESIRSIEINLDRPLYGKAQWPSRKFTGLIRCRHRLH